MLLFCLHATITANKGSRYYRVFPLRSWLGYQSITRSALTIDSLTQTNSLTAAAASPWVAGQRSICAPTDKLADLSATGNDALFVHAQSRAPPPTRDDRKRRAICRMTQSLIGDGRECTETRSIFFTRLRRRHKSLTVQCRTSH